MIQCATIQKSLKENLLLCPILEKEMQAVVSNATISTSNFHFLPSERYGKLKVDVEREICSFLKNRKYVWTEIPLQCHYYKTVSKS